MFALSPGVIPLRREMLALAVAALAQGRGMLARSG
jgi:hypothetical protein